MNTGELAIIKLIGQVAALENEMAMGRQYYEGLEQRVKELEIIIAGKRRPPSRLAQTFKLHRKH
jgi:hypothetical protein